MQGVSIQALRDSGIDRKALAAYMAGLNGDPAHRIGFCDETPEAVLSSFADFGDAVEETFVIARKGSVIDGVLGFDADSAIGRAWLWGPFIGGGNWHELADELWAALAPMLPTYVSQLEMFYDVQNKRCDEFARARDFELIKDDVSILQLLRSDAPEPARPQPLNGDLHAAVAALHDRLFPNTFLPSGSMFSILDDTHRVFVATENGSLTGYVYGEVHADAGLANLHYVGVDEGFRGRGIASGLVRAFTAWVFSFNGVEEIALTVDRDNARARRIYSRLGFEHLFDARAMRLPWTG
jgi:GNAT superfamily N-acetyltransferase